MTVEISNSNELAKYLLRGGIVLLTIFILISFNHNIDSGRSSLQHKYESWLSQLNESSNDSLFLKQGDFDDNLTASVEPNSLPRTTVPVVGGIDVSLLATNAGQQIHVVLNARATKKIDTESRRTQLVRVLELIKEGNLFSLPIEEQTNVEPFYEIKVHSESENFVARFSQTQISANPPVQLLLKLLQIYGESPTKSLAKLNSK